MPDRFNSNLRQHLRLSPELLVQAVFNPRAAALTLARSVAVGTLREAWGALPEGYRDAAANAAGAYAGQKEQFLKTVVSRPWGLYSIIGERGSGKTALACGIAEAIQREQGKAVHVLGMPQEVLPPTWRAIAATDLAKIDSGVLVIDDASLFISSRDWRDATARELERKCDRARHNDLVLILTSPISTGVNRYVFGGCDALFLKPPPLLYELVERSRLERYLEMARSAFRDVPEIEWRSWVFVVAQSFTGLLHYDKPGWYGAAQSKTQIRGIDVRGDKTDGDPDNPEHDSGGQPAGPGARAAGRREPGGRADRGAPEP